MTKTNPILQNKWLDWVAIALIGLLLQGFWAIRISQPTYMDAYYYTTNGQRLANGYSFTEEVIWQFLDDPDGIPTPSHSYWMPLTSIVAAGGYLFGDSFRAAQLPFWLLAGLLPLLAYAISCLLNQPRWVCWIAALFTASGGFYNNFYNQPATFSLFAWAGGLCLLALAKGSLNDNWRWWWVIAGVMAGLGHLTRADGMLLVLVGGLLAFVGWRSSANYRRIGTRLGLLGTGYFAVTAVWFWRNWLTFGRPFPTAGTQTIFLTTYDDLFAYGRSFDLSHLLSWGWPEIIQSRLHGLSTAVQTFIAINCLIFLVPFVLWAWWRLGKSQWVVIRPFTFYFAALYLSMSLVFTFPGVRGGLFHSSAALFPWTMSLAAAGIPMAVNWLGTKLPHWEPERSGPLFAGLFVVVAMIMTISLGIVRTPGLPETAVYETIATILPEDAVVMSGNAPGFYYHTGLPSVSAPNESPEILLRAAKKYQVTHLVLDENRPIPLDGLYAGREQVLKIQLLNDYDGIKLYQINN
ncbi:MAG: hypothetical protein DWQ04_23710 [Chloroflexi bacterium]|nr:MAG: hypothetical protein DWQ04_23710 [Chloroflexota bacterium]